MRAFLAGTFLVVALALAGCGGSSSPSTSGGNGEALKSAQQILSDAVTAADAASALRMSGQINSNGQQIGIDLTIVKGKGAMGSLTIKGHKVDLVVIGTDAYMNADAAFWTLFGGAAGSTIGQMLQGKWLKFSTTNPQFGSITAIADSKALFKSLSASHGTLANKGASTYKGQSVVGISDGTKIGTLYVAATGTAYPVALVKPGAGGGAIMFNNWNTSVTLTAPANALDFSHLGG